MTAHIYQTRVYYEDTDAAGVVFYANYLKYTERARTEFLRAVGVNHGQIVQKDQKSFVVRRCTLDYLRPARLDDVLEVHTKPLALKGATLELSQAIFVGDRKLVDTKVTLAFVNLITLRPERIWDSILNGLQSFQKNY